MFSAGAGVFFPEPEFFLPEPEPEVKNPEFAQHYNGYIQNHSFRNPNFRHASLHLSHLSY